MVARRLLSVLALTGLLVTLVAWVISYTGYYSFRGSRNLITLYSGHAQYLQTNWPWAERPKAANYPLGWQWLRYQQISLNTLWKPWLTIDPSYWTVHVPLWIPTVLFGLLFWAVCVRGYRRRRRQDRGLCLECGYDLTGNVSGRCSECRATVPKAPQATGRLSRF